MEIVFVLQGVVGLVVGVGVFKMVMQFFGIIEINIMSVLLLIFIGDNVERVVEVLCCVGQFV